MRNGSVDLQKRVVVEKSNFMEASRGEYTRRVKSFNAAHTLGKVQVKQYFGLLESLTDATKAQISCQFGTAAEDGTELMWISKANLVHGMHKDKI